MSLVVKFRAHTNITVGLGIHFDRLLKQEKPFKTLSRREREREGGSCPSKRKPDISTLKIVAQKSNNFHQQKLKQSINSPLSCVCIEQRGYKIQQKILPAFYVGGQWLLSRIMFLTAWYIDIYYVYVCLYYIVYRIYTIYIYSIYV